MNRTRKDWEEYCLGILKKDRLFTVWWATGNMFIANAMDRLIKSKRIKVSNKGLIFPRSKAIIRRIK